MKYLKKYIEYVKLRKHISKYFNIDERTAIFVINEIHKYIEEVKNEK